MIGAEYAQRLQDFVARLCTGRQYDSCVNSPCRYASYHGCQHPSHPMHQRDRERAAERERAK